VGGQLVLGLALYPSSSLKEPGYEASPRTRCPRGTCSPRTSCPGGQLVLGPHVRGDISTGGHPVLWQRYSGDWTVRPTSSPASSYPPSYLPSHFRSFIRGRRLKNFV